MCYYSVALEVLKHLPYFIFFFHYELSSGITSMVQIVPEQHKRMSKPLSTTKLTRFPHFHILDFSESRSCVLLP